MSAAPAIGHLAIDGATADAGPPMFTFGRQRTLDTALLKTGTLGEHFTAMRHALGGADRIDEASAHGVELRPMPAIHSVAGDPSSGRVVVMRPPRPRR